jgi:hypothetical protein
MFGHGPQIQQQWVIQTVTTNDNDNNTKTTATTPPTAPTTPMNSSTPLSELFRSENMSHRSTMIEGSRVTVLC